MIVGGLVAVALIVAWAVTRAPAATFMPPSVMPVDRVPGATERRSGLGSALDTLNQLAQTGASLYSQTQANSKSTGLSAAIGGQK